MALKEYFLTDSNKSIMRLTFFMTVVTGLVIALGTSIAALIAGFQEKRIDVSAVVTIVGLLIGGGMVGKAGQTFGESLESKKIAEAAATVVDAVLPSKDEAKPE